MKFIIALIALSSISVKAQNSQVVKFHSSQIEALEGKDGTYARYADISEGFVSYEGVSTKDESLFVDLNKSKLSSIILQDGSHINEAILNTAAVVVGGDMGGGGTAQ
jgi:hypothetical protein